MKSNFEPPKNLPDFDKITWKCPCCGLDRTDKYIKVMHYDVSDLFDLSTGSMVINCRYCVDMPGCHEKAFDRNWVIDHFLGKYIPGRGLDK